MAPGSRVLLPEFQEWQSGERDAKAAYPAAGYETRLSWNDDSSPKPTLILGATCTIDTNSLSISERKLLRQSVRAFEDDMQQMHRARPRQTVPRLKTPPPAGPCLLDYQQGRSGQPQSTLGPGPEVPRLPVSQEKCKSSIQEAIASTLAAIGSQQQQQHSSLHMHNPAWSHPRAARALRHSAAISSPEQMGLRGVGQSPGMVNSTDCSANSSERTSPLEAIELWEADANLMIWLTSGQALTEAMGSDEELCAEEGENVSKHLEAEPEGDGGMLEAVQQEEAEDVTDESGKQSLPGAAGSPGGLHVPQFGCWHKATGEGHSISSPDSFSAAFRKAKDRRLNRALTKWE